MINITIEKEEKFIDIHNRLVNINETFLSKDTIFSLKKKEIVIFQIGKLIFIKMTKKLPTMENRKTF